jgi:hypothetical protein
MKTRVRDLVIAIANSVIAGAATPVYGPAYARVTCSAAATARRVR